MINHSRHRFRVWTSLLLLLALLAAQPLWAKHIHLESDKAELCDLCFNHVPAAPGSAVGLTQPAPVVLYATEPAPIPHGCQPERQSARAPPTTLSHI